jgi:DNA-binding PadR family transcriptional regulator
MTRRRSNPLALAMMALLFERPMHPYEMASSMRTRRKEGSIRLSYGSLYSWDTPTCAARSCRRSF